MTTYVSYVDCRTQNGEQYLIRWQCDAENGADAQAQTIAYLGDSRSIPTGPGGMIAAIETVAAGAIRRSEVRRRDVPLFELVP
jgi:hypothetical protein